MNYEFLLKSGSGMPYGTLWNLQNPLFEDSRGDSFLMPRIYADDRYFRKSKEINVGNKKITNRTDPQSDTDAINKQYLENLILNPAITIINSNT